MTERQSVTSGLFALAVLMLGMAWWDPKLWDVELFKIILQAVIISGLLNMVGAFHFSANKSDEQKVENTARAFEAITATANASTAPADAADGANAVADAATNKAHEIAGEK